MVKGSKIITEKNVESQHTILIIIYSILLLKVKKLLFV